MRTDASALFLALPQATPDDVGVAICRRWVDDIAGGGPFGNAPLPPLEPDRRVLLDRWGPISSVCASWVAASSDAPGGGGKGAAAEKTRMVLNSGELSEDQHFLALGFESEGYVPEEAKKLLHAWAKQHKEDNDLTNGDMSLMLFKWTTELAFIRAKLLAKCILERAAFSAEKQDNIDGITPDVGRIPYVKLTAST